MNVTKQQKGFTIIEVLIVLAIAGLIMLIVFLAVPALQRNSRNTQIRNDAAVVLAGVSEYTTNSGGALPTAISVSGGEVSITGTGPTSVIRVRGGTTVNLSSGAGGASGADITVRTTAKCGTGGLAVAGTGRAVAATFNIEGAGALIPQCIEG